MSAFAIVPILLLLLNSVYAVRPNDQIVVPDLPVGSNSFYIKDEIYSFIMLPAYWVPLQINRHVIYTATTQTIATLTANALGKKRSSLLHLAPQDYEVVQALLGEVPGNVRVDSKKRVAAGGPRRITLSDDAFLLVTEDGSLKRDGVTMGDKLCLHIPFFTSCDNSIDLDQVKSVLQAQNDALRTELDSYKRTNDARDNELAAALIKQKDLVTEIAKQTQTELAMVRKLTSMSKTNLVQTQHGDQVVHSQINSLKRITNSLLRFSNAIGSTDPRTVVAQPAMAKLFNGFKLLLNEFANPSDPLETSVRKPILDSRTFNFSEIVLPNEAVKNVTVNGTMIMQKDSANYRGFSVSTIYGCAMNTITAEKFCNSSFNPTTGAQTNPSVYKSDWMWGPFHTNHWGLYEVVNGGPFEIQGIKVGEVISSREAAIAIPQKSAVAWSFPPATVNMSCVSFLGFNVLASFTSTPRMINGIPEGTAPLPMSSCINYLLYGASSNTYYRLFSLTEGITVPFYSNCDRETLVSEAGLTLPTGYLSKYPNVIDPMDNTTDKFNFEFYAKHYVSKSCYINMEPEWIGLNYYINNAPTVIRDIPRGYKFNQFTINPQGELASSLEFVYTRKWALVYKIFRTSVDYSNSNATISGTGNRVIVDEVDLLDGESVLFLQTDNNNIIDESDSMFGEGNNGRDCIQVPIEYDVNNAPYPANSFQYDYDLTDCFFQNDEIGYPAGNYLAGLIKTSGISRFNNKFLLTLYNNTYNGLPAFSFTLKAKPEADFRFYVLAKPDTCAQIIRRSISEGKCLFEFFYQGNETVKLNDTNINFVGLTTTIEVGTSYWPYRLTVGSRNCMVVTCRKTVNSTYVQLDTPAFEVVSKTDINMNAAVQSSLDKLMSGQLSTLANMEVQVQAAMDHISAITALLNTIDFNVSKLFPYENFTSLRASVDAATAKVGDNYCSGPFESIQCWAKDFGSTILAVVVILAVVGLVVLFLFKTSAGGKIRAKMCPASDSCETPSGYPDTTTSNPSENSKKKPKKALQPPGDFELIASN